MEAVYIKLFGALLTLPVTSVLASDACATRSVEAHANVSVSDGSAFEVSTYFRDKDAAAIHFGGERASTVAVEGPYAWAIQDDKARLVSAPNKAFALGHQYHAILLYFEDIFDDVEAVENIEFSGGRYTGRQGIFPDGGTVTIIDGKTPKWPLGVRFELPEAPPVDTFFDGWRNHDGRDLPYQLRIDDGQRQFEYKYTRISVSDRSPHWFRESLPVSQIDELEVYRLHRRLMAAHCLGDAKLIADLTAPETVVANRGELDYPTKEETRELFDSVFTQVTYDHYVDLAPPVIELSASKDLGWIAVKIQTAGKSTSNRQGFNQQWAWIMLVKKIDGVWLNAGNSSNYRTP